MALDLLDPVPSNQQLITKIISKILELASCIGLFSLRRKERHALLVRVKVIVIVKAKAVRRRSREKAAACKSWSQK